MPKHTLTSLIVLTVLLLCTYVAGMALTIFFATMKTELTAQIESAETRVGALETGYYDAIAELNATDMQVVGYVAPKQVAYVTRDGKHTVTRADR